MIMMMKTMESARTGNPGLDRWIEQCKKRVVETEGLMGRVNMLEETANRHGLNDAAKLFRSLHFELEQSIEQDNCSYLPQALREASRGATQSPSNTIAKIERAEERVENPEKDMVACDVKYLPNMPNDKVDIHWEYEKDKLTDVKEFDGNKSKLEVYTISKSEFQLKKVAGTAGNIRSELLEPCKPDAAEERIHESEPGAYAMAYACGVTLNSPPTEYRLKLWAWEQVVRKAASMVPAEEMKQRIRKAGDDMLIELGKIKADMVNLLRFIGRERYADEIEDPHYGE
jgi:hypothetical protein